MKKLFLSLILLLVFSSDWLFSQSGMDYPEFEKKLLPFFPEELISDIPKQLPMGSRFAVWGWDVDDFSGDGINDLAFTVKLAQEKKRIVQVYLFVDIDGFLEKVAQFNYEYFELPLEIGIVIRDNSCFVTQKNKEFDWKIDGYRYETGSIFLIDSFSAFRFNNYTRESYRNYNSLLNTDKIFLTRNGDLSFKTNYLTIPSYSRGKLLYHPYNTDATANSVEYVFKGAYYWTGEDDASFSVKSAYCDEYIYFTVDVRDDRLVFPECDTCIGDYLEVWLDINPLDSTGGRFFKLKDKEIELKNKIQKGIYCVKIYPGNFYDKRAFVKEISSTDDIESYQQEATNNIKVASSLKEKGFELKFKIPFSFLGFNSLPLDGKKPYDIGCSFVYCDIDSPWRPEEEKRIASSAFSQNNPSSFGSLIIIPFDKWYGYAQNIYVNDIQKHLIDYGF
ncbi:MAG: hypothetical protein GX121_01420 [Ignavibacteria bacterium]|nr:hypothetical protein [Ignavibacteria bacterium]